MYTYDPKEVGDRAIALGDGKSAYLHLYEEKEMFDKQAQRMRAVNQAQALAKLGVTAPVLPPIPVAPPAPVYYQRPVQPKARAVKTVHDLRGKEINIGDEVAYSRYKGASLMVGKVVGFSQSRKSVMISGPRYHGTRSVTEFYKPITAVLKLC